MIILGYDPGGKGESAKTGKNGAAILRVDGSRLACSVTNLASVDAVMDWFAAKAGDNIPDAAGIDAQLTWETVAGGWRQVDILLRKKYAEIANSVLSLNSTPGAVAIQGVAMAIRLRQRWPSIKLNETHPKVQYYALRQQKHDFESLESSMLRWLNDKLGATNSFVVATEDQWDALFSAWATLQGLLEDWKHDLSQMQPPQSILPAGSVSYFWPDLG